MQEILSLQTRSSDSEFDEPLVCLICGFKSDTSLISHIERKHKIKSSLYREKFNTKILQRATKKAIENNSAAQKKLLQDAEKINALKMLGYKVVVIWEHDWRHNIELCKEKIKEALLAA